MPGFGLGTFILMTYLTITAPYEVGTIFILVLQETDSEWAVPLLRGRAGITSDLSDSRACAGTVLDTVLNCVIIIVIVIHVNGGR